MSHDTIEFRTRHDHNSIQFPSPRAEHFRDEVLKILKQLTDRVDPIFANSDSGSTLRKVSDDSYEPAVALTEYYSPNQHGGINGTVYRRYYAVPEVSDASTGVTIDLTFTITGRVVHVEGMVELQAGGNFLPLPYTDILAAGDASISVNVTLDDIILVKTTLVSDWKAGGFIAVDYTK